MADQEETEKGFELRIRSAEREHDRDLKGVEVHTKQIETFSQMAMRAPALVAAGGVAASLGFYSANYQRLAGHAEALKLFNDALAWMLIGILLTLFAPGLAYFSQLAYLDSVSSREHHWFHPYSRETRRARVGEIIGNICRWACVLVVIASIVSIAIGGIKFLHLVAAL